MVDFGFEDQFTPVAVRVEHIGHKTVVHVLLATAAQVRGWAAARGVEVSAGAPKASPGAVRWFRHTRAVTQLPGVKVVVAACESATDPGELEPFPVAGAVAV